MVQTPLRFAANGGLRLVKPFSGTSSELALEASRRALAAAGVDAAELDLIIVATSTPDFIFPSTACLLQSKLGNHGAVAFDVQAVCAGFIYALSIAEKFIRSRYRPFSHTVPATPGMSPTIKPLE